ncbi:hypothetical protein M501DRAFT_995130 [Patellaria atrata CBS 101060]|uniref:PAC domain-containing protein n=1 Tax=Patellaria atrata CBS 101060 TaxID=1346257 RepID=A0A9P4S886_9PEZI|nr:hypothetical protein M501DRAFT_995130 [Patellaria atrata CBS 101060]
MAPFRDIKKKRSAYSIFRQYPVASSKQSGVSKDDSRPVTALNDSPIRAASPKVPRPNYVANSTVRDFQETLNPEHQLQPPRTPVQDQTTPHNLQVGLSSDDDDDEVTTPPQELTPRGIHIPSRTSSAQKIKKRFRPSSRSQSRQTSYSLPTTPDSYPKSSRDSIFSTETSITAPSELPALQANTLPAEEAYKLEPLVEDDPKSYDLIAAADLENSKEYSLERRSEQLFSRQHLEAIFADSAQLQRFTDFLGTKRSSSIPVLIYYLDALKALRAINYANAVAEALEPMEGHEFSEHPARPTVNSILEEKADKAFEALVKDELPAFITHTFTELVSESIHRRITGTLPPHLREASEGLAEVFCLSDPSRPDNPLVFASEEFHRTTQYGVSYAVGRNCRFLQGPKTNRNSVSRLRDAINAGKEVSEVFLNYRRDGSPFMNLLMVAPLLDSKGTLRYFIGAQVDVSGLVKDCSDLPALKAMLEKDDASIVEDKEETEIDEFQRLSEMFNLTELDTVRRYGGRMHRQQIDEIDDAASIIHRPRLLLKHSSHEEFSRRASVDSRKMGKLQGVYQHYLLVRPYPSLRILFTSPSLRVPGIMQSPFLSRIGNQGRVREELVAALAEGRGVTAKVRWMSSSGNEGRNRWIHCTPLLGNNGGVGVWMIVIVDDESSLAGRKFRQAPPVEAPVGRKVRRDRDEWMGEHAPSPVVHKVRLEEGFRQGSVHSMDSYALG